MRHCIVSSSCSLEMILAALHVSSIGQRSIPRIPGQRSIPDSRIGFLTSMVRLYFSKEVVAPPRYPLPSTVFFLTALCLVLSRLGTLKVPRGDSVLASCTLIFLRGTHLSPALVCHGEEFWTGPCFINTVSLLGARPSDSRGENSNRMSSKHAWRCGGVWIFTSQE